MDAQTINAIVLAGGLSQRMGQNKALLLWQHSSFLAHLIDCCAGFFGKVLLVVKDPALYQEFCGGGVSLVADLNPDRAAMVGVYSGLVYSDTPWNFVVAVDMPHWDRAQIRRMMFETHTASCDHCAPVGVLPVCQGRIHPLKGFYHRDILSTLTQTVDDKKYNLTKYLESQSVKLLESDQKFVANINTPHDYQLWQHAVVGARC